MLFSATMPPEIEGLGKQFLRDPERVKAPQTGITADKVTQRITLMAESEKRDQLSDILRDETTGQVLIFVRTKRRADALAKFLSVRGLSVDALHGDMRQTVRQKVLRNFRSGELRALIATDVAARGIDVAGLSHVVNFDLTDTPEAYVHRIGRTGRAGLGGLALSFCAPDEQHKLAAIISVVGGRIELFELDGTPITDFKAAPGAGKQRRQRARPVARGGRPERASSRAAGSDKRPPRQPKPLKKRKRGADADAGERRPLTDRDATERHDKQQRPSKPARSGKPATGKSPAGSGQKLFSKRPKFNSRPNFGDSPATPSRPWSQSGKPDTPGQKHKHGPAGKAGNKTGHKSEHKAGGAQQRDGNGGAGNYAGGRAKKPGHKTRFRGAAGDGQSSRRHSKLGSKSAPGGQGRLKRRP
jgi:ATP-dependent RNA helicase RhlE